MKDILRYFTAIGAVLLASPTFAEVKNRMDTMIQQTFTLKPYIISPHEYSKAMNTQTIDEALKTLIRTTAQVHGEDKIKDTPLELSASRLLQQLRNAEAAFTAGSKDYSLWLLRGSLGNCLACHTQTASGSTTFKAESKGRPLYNTFQEAEFLYLARNYTEAIKLYNKAIAEYPAHKITWAEVEQALYRKIYYYIRVKRDLAGLQASLDADLKNKQFTMSLMKLFKEYRNAAQSVSGPAFPSFSPTQTKELRSFSESLLKEEIEGKIPRENAARVVDNLRLSSILYEYLKQNPKTDLQPEIYYWLSFCENHPRKFSFDFMSELYLKKCITDFPESSVAPKCLKEYKDLVTTTYTGSSGAPLPDLIRQELKSMEDLLQNIKK